MDVERALSAVEAGVLEELMNICNNNPLSPGETISHKTAGICVKRGWARRNGNGDFVPTPNGRDVLQFFLGER